LNEEPGFDDHGPTIGGAKPATQRINAIAAATFAKTNNLTIRVTLMNARMTVAIASQAAPSTPREPPTGVDRVARGGAVDERDFDDPGLSLRGESRVSQRRSAMTAATFARTKTLTAVTDKTYRGAPSLNGD
jgi:hypothetical protein